MKERDQHQNGPGLCSPENIEMKKIMICVGAYGKYMVRKSGFIIQNAINVLDVMTFTMKKIYSKAFDFVKKCH
jgi:hypothetical protein